MKYLATMISVCLLASFTVQLEAEVKVRVDENGKQVFYNDPPVKKDPIVVPAKFTYSKKLKDYSGMIDEISAKHQVDPNLVKAMIQVESAYNSTAISPAGAMGLMQLMPGTADRFGVKEIYDPRSNISGGVKYLRFLLDLFKSDLSLVVAAYNAGERAVQRFRGIPSYRETQAYVRKVLSLYYADPNYVAPQIKVPTVYYKYSDAKGIVHYTTVRPASKDAIEIKF